MKIQGIVDSGRGLALTKARTVRKASQKTSGIGCL